MHDDYTLYLVDHVEEWHGSDDFGISFAWLDLCKIDYETTGDIPEEFVGTCEGFIGHELMERYDARHVIVTWSSDGVREIHPMPDYNTAKSEFDTLMNRWEEFGYN